MLEGRTTAAVEIGGVEKPLIRGEIAAADALQGSGIIRYRGSCEVDAIVTPAPGTVVTFSYTKGGVTTTVPHKMRVLSSFANPITGTTSVELGCKLTYLSDRQPAIENPGTADENSGIPCEVFRKGTLSLSASYVFDQCLTALGITASSNPLTNTFAIWEFDLSGGYVQAMSDLLSSECYVGELDFDEVLQVRSLEDETATGPLLTDADVIEMGPVGSGRLPGDAVVVRYSKRTLKAPDDDLSDEDEAKQNWEYSKSVQISPQAVLIKQGIDYNGNAAKIVYYPYNITETYTYYDVLDRVVRRETYTRRPLAEVNMQIFEDAYLPESRSFTGFAGNRPGDRDFADDYTQICIFRPSNIDDPYTTLGSPVPGWEDLPDEFYGNQCQKSIKTLDVEEIEYEFPAPLAVEDPLDTVADCEAKREAAELENEDRSKEKVRRRTRYESQTQLISAVPFPNYSIQYVVYLNSAGADGFVPFSQGIEPTVEVERSETYFDPVQASLRLAQYGATNRLLSEITTTEKTQSTTFRWLIFLYSVQGQQLSARRALTLVASAISVSAGRSYYESALDSYMPGWYSEVPQEVLQELVIGREFGLQERPNAAERSGLANGVPEPTEQTTELAWVYGAVTSQDVVEFQLPLAPDDKLTWTALDGWSFTPGDAQDKAIRYGRVQNRLLLGNRQGAELQVLPEKMPPRAFDTLYLTIDGLTVQYRINNGTWVLQPGEVVTGCNALFWGVVGGTPGYDVADAWVPLALGTSSLPVTPAGTGDPTYGTVLAPTGIEKPYTETVSYGVIATRGAFSLSAENTRLRERVNYVEVMSIGRFTMTGYEKHPIEYGNSITRRSFIVTGRQMTPTLALGMTAASGAFTLSGNTATLAKVRGLPIAAGSFILSGAAIATTVDLSTTASAGSFTLTGNSATLYFPEPHLYWRITGIVGISDFLEVSEFQLHSSGGRQAATSLTSSDTPSLALANFDDNDTGTRCYWDSTIATDSGFYVQWEYSSAKAIIGCKIGGYDTSSRYPTGFTLSYSDNGTDFTVAGSASGLSYPGNSTLSSLIEIP